MKIRNVIKVKADNPDHQKYMDWIDTYYKKRVLKREMIFTVIKMQFPELLTQPELVQQIGKEWSVKKFGK